MHAKYVRILLAVTSSECAIRSRRRNRCQSEIAASTIFRLRFGVACCVASRHTDPPPYGGASRGTVQTYYLSDYCSARTTTTTTSTTNFPPHITNKHTATRLCVCVCGPTDLWPHLHARNALAENITHCTCGVVSDGGLSHCTGDKRTAVSVLIKPHRRPNRMTRFGSHFGIGMR